MTWTNEQKDKAREISDAIARGAIERATTTDTKKLTGREAVIALLEGKKVFRSSHPVGKIVVTYNLLDTCFEGNFPKDKNMGPEALSMEDVLKHHDWEILKERMVWEGEMLFDTLANYGINALPSGLFGKRVKVRIEEIL